MSGNQPAPLRFADQAACMSITSLMKRYRAGRKAIVRWLGELPADAPRYIPNTTPPVAPIRAMPEGFAAVALTTTFTVMRVMYGAGEMTLRRWVGELPAELRADRLATLRAAKVAAQTGKSRKSKRGRGPSMLAKFDGETKSRTFADLAAMHLQSRRFVPVCRATIYGKQYAGLWQVGRLKMPETEMVALARKQGWAA